MTSIVGSAVFGIAVVCAVVYNLAYYRLYRVIASERPEWVAAAGSTSPIYPGPLRAWNPNIAMAVLKVAFSSRSAALSAAARPYVSLVRVCLPLGMACFLVVPVWST
jgi:hypothetical protein